MITGEYRNSLDDKGRLMIPAKLRSEISGNVMVLTRGIDRAKCIWLFPPEEWRRISETLLTSTSIFQKQARLLHRRFIAPAQEAEIDRSGRITIPPSLREYGDLKKDCIVLGVLNRLEIWDEEAYRTYWEDREDEFQEAAEEIGKDLKIM
ncbi:MAG TPA: division/cell wall cluster transcriptional repressor MraZ [Spirochaetia bacterium]|nr:division/cell wall cluster transcriptional repressor MraZ [Spirochaetia bacterium]